MKSLGKVEGRALAIAALALWVGSQGAIAERADYGLVELNGLARDTDWPYNAPGVANAMICDVNGPDGFLTIRTGPGANYAAARSLKRLAIVEVDTRDRRGNWIRVRGAHRSFTPEGARTPDKDLPVTGWAHDGYLCSYIDYAEPEASANPQTGTKSAACEWDDGSGGPAERYACEFLPFDGNGSFSAVRSDGYELMLEVKNVGIANVTEFANGRRLGEFGRFSRSEVDRACWESEMGAARLCVH